MLISIRPDLPTLGQYAAFVSSLPRSQSFLAFLKNLRGNYSVLDEDVAVEFVAPDVEVARAELFAILEKVADLVPSNDQLQRQFNDLAEQVTVADRTEDLLQILPHAELLVANSLSDATVYARGAV